MLEFYLQLPGLKQRPEKFVSIWNLCCVQLTSLETFVISMKNCFYEASDIIKTKS